MSDAAEEPHVTIHAVSRMPSEVSIEQPRNPVRTCEARLHRGAQPHSGPRIDNADLSCQGVRLHKPDVIVIFSTAIEAAVEAISADEKSTEMQID
jgi:hypothetical protein